MMQRLDDLPRTVLVLAIIGIVGAIGALIVSEMQSDIETDYGTDSAAYNVTEDGLDGISGLTGQLDIVGLVLGFGIVLTAVAGFGFAAYRRFQ